MASNKDLCQYFFTLEAPGIYKCRYCPKLRKQAPGSGFSNLIGHLTDKHPQHQEDYKEHERSGCKDLATFGFVTDYACTVYNWMNWVVGRNVLIEEVDNEVTRAMSRWNPVSSKTLKKYMALVEREVEAAIAEEMPESIG
ncbi:hypothetical protein L915_02106, partial [Phytophthora nicotianae]